MRYDNDDESNDDSYNDLIQNTTIYKYVYTKTHIEIYLKMQN